MENQMERVFSKSFVIEPAHKVARKQANTITALGQPAAEPVPCLPTLVDTILTANREEWSHGLGFIKYCGECGPTASMQELCDFRT